MSQAQTEAPPQPSSPGQQSDWITRAMARFGKLLIASRAARMQDNMRTVDRTAKADTAYRNRVARLHETLGREVYGENWVSAESPEGQIVGEDLQADDMGGINIDSPTTENHYHYAEPAPTAAKPAAGLSTLAKAAISAALLGAGAVGGAGIPWLAGAYSRPAAPVSAPAVPAQAAPIAPPAVQQAQPAVSVPAAAQPAPAAPATSPPAAVNEYQLKMLPQ